MMLDQVICTDIGKRYGYHWIFKHLDFQFSKNKSYGIIGPNGSGKSTLLKVLCGFSTPSMGQISFESANTIIPIAQVYKSVAISAPYIHLIDNLKVIELLHFQHKFKPFYDLSEAIDIINDLPFKGLLQLNISELSSGMLQRIKLATSILSQSGLLLLDEPGSNLDDEGKIWWQQLLDIHRKDRIIIIASNEAEDLKSVDQSLSLLDYKIKK